VNEQEGLVVRELSVSYGKVPAVRGASLNVARGEVVALIGPNSAGKTSLLQAIGVRSPWRKVAGSVHVDGRRIDGRPTRARWSAGLRIVPQGREIFPSLTVEENLRVAARSPERHNWNLERVYDLFPRLAERRQQRAKTLSGGEQQMLAIGRALMTNPDCLVMDEPSEGLAPIIIQGLWEAIAKLKEQGLSILLVEQNANLALKLVDYVHVMSKGQVVYSATPQELRANDKIKSSYLGI